MISSMFALPHPTRRLLQHTAVVLAASAPASRNDDNANDNSFDVNTHFSPSMAIILVVLLAAFFFMGFFSIYVRRCATRHDNEALARARAGAGAHPTAAATQTSQGLDAAVLETLPLVTYNSAKKKGSGSNVECVVCLTDFNEGEPLCQLPRCRHVFHKECIDMWLFSHKTCPLCRRSVLAADGSRSFRWGGSGSLRLSTGGRRGSRRESGHGSGPSTPVELQGGLSQLEANANSDGIGLYNVFPRSHSTGHSLAKQSHSRELLLEVPEQSDGSEDAQRRTGCLPLTPPVVFQRSRSMAAIAAGGEVPAPVSIRAWMKRALSVKKVKPTAGDFENPQGDGVAAAAASSRSTFDRLV